MSRNSGFTLVELVIVVLIVGILAAIVVPRFTDASDRTRDVSARSQLGYLRGQIELFKMQHGGVPPQEGAMWTLLQRQSGSMETATPAPTGNQYGPYFRADPSNPWNGMTAVNSQATDPGAGWYYKASPTTYELRIRNADGSINTQY